LGRRSRKRYRKVVRPVRRLPKVFQCPACGLPTLTVEVKVYTDEVGEERKAALIRCFNPQCMLRAELKDLPPVFEPVDAYAKFLDAFTQGTVEVRYERGEEGEEG